MTSKNPISENMAPITNSTASETTPLYDLVCIGFSAAQLATAVAIRESRKPLKVLFIERKPAFSSHKESHLSRTRMENPFLFDLATPRNPRSAFSYVNYLLARKRLIEFANSDRLNPLREEFSDYLAWCAEQFKDQVKYNSEVVKVNGEAEKDVINTWKVVVKDGSSTEYLVRTRNIIAPFPSRADAPKAVPLPSVDFLAGQRIVPMEDYSLRRNELRGIQEPRLNIAVVGSGPQTAEILDDLLSCSRLGNITVVTEDESLASLRVLGEQEPPQPRLCSIWAKPSYNDKGSVTEASEIVQNIYMRAYEKQVVSKGEYGLRVVIGKDAAEPCSKSDFIIRDTTTNPILTGKLLQNLDTLVLGCRSKGSSLEEVQFKHGAVAKGCNLFLISGHTDGGRSLAKDIAITAGEVVKKLGSSAEERREGAMVHARM